MARNRTSRVLFALALVIAAGAAVMTWRHRSDPVRRIVVAAGRQRVIEARLSGGFEWAPLHRRALPRMMLDSSEDGRHATALAMLLTGNGRRGLEQLEQLAAEHPHDAQLWSDVAAARYEAGVASDDAALIAGSLAAADEALRSSRSLPEALFNRALAVERLGIRDEARKAWTRFLAVDGTSEWAAEARERIRHLAPIPFFIVDLRKHYDRLASDPEAAHELARERPEEARLYSETLILADWAAAMSAGDATSAARHLRVAREFGVALARNHGECMVQQAVRAIDDANAEQLQHLVRGHLLFRDAQNQFKTDHAAVAQEMFVRAADELSRGGSPVKLLAEFFLAHTFHALGNLPEARRRELLLLADTPPEFRACRAQLLWHLGLGYQSDGDWGKALDAFTQSVGTFEDLGEDDYAAAVREPMAEIHDRNGDPQEAWRTRVVSLRGIGRMTTARLAMALDNIGRGAMLRKEWPVALSFLQIAGDSAQEIGRPTAETEMRLLQARALAQMGDRDAAHASISKARAATTKIDDAAARRDALADIDRTEAMVTSSPRVAVSLLTRAIDYHATQGRRVLLPELFLLRGRAYRDLGQPARAASDFEAGIVEVEEHRESLPQGQARWSTFEPAAELFEDAVALAIRRGDAAAAFAYAERSRARELLETLGPTAPLRVFDGDTSLIEYFPLADRLVIFAVHAGVIHVAEAAIDRATLEKKSDAFRGALAAGSPQHHALGQSLYARLVAPVEREIGSSKTLVFVAGPGFPHIPFAALQTASGYLIERYDLVIAPSAGVYAKLAARNASSSQSVLVLANPSTQLIGAEAEAERVSQLYAHSHQLLRGDANVRAYRRYAPSADIIHLATHGDGGELLLTDGRLDSQTIASIALPRTRVVVLAACDSARGPERAEGTISAARGFLAAGVPAVIATIWPIDDGASARFFPRVHRELARGAGAAAAVRDAQRESIERKESPAVWAAVECIGTDGG